MNSIFCKTFLLLFCVIIPLVSRTQDWLHTGPSGGNITAFSYAPSDPSVMYAGTSTGRVYYSHDSGDSWQSWYSTNYGEIDVLRCHPTNPDEVWMITPTGLYKSEDGSESWFYIEVSGADSTWFLDLAIHSTNSDTLFITARDLFRSNDSGITWQLVEDTPFNPYSCYKIIEDPQNSEHLLICASNIYESWDSGTTWTLLTDPGGGWYQEVCINPDNPEQMWGIFCNGWDGEYIHVTEDNWETWERQSGPFDIWFQMNLSVRDLHISSDGTLYIHDVHGAYHSNDGGETWDSVRVNTEPTFIWDNDYDGVDFEDRFFTHPDREEEVFCSTIVGLFKSEDAGTTFVDSDYGIIETSIERSISDSSTNKLHTCGSNGVWISEDDGNSWNRIIYEMGKDIVVHPDNPDSMLFIGKRLLRTFDGGQTVHLIQTNIPHWFFEASDVNPFNPDEVLMTCVNFGVGETVYRTSDFGDTWEQIYPGLVGNAPIEIRHDPVVGNRIFILHGGIFVSTDCGETWERLLPDYYFYDIDFNPANNSILAVSRNVVFVSAYDVLDFQEVYDSPNPDLWFSDGIFHPFDSSIILSASYDITGLYILENDSLRLIECTNDLPIFDIAYTHESGMLYLGTTNDGIWSLPLEYLDSPEPETSPLPSSLSIDIFPNPFNSSTKITVSLPDEGKMSVSVYNTLGQEVARLADRAFSAGEHSLTFDASHLSSGIYFIGLDLDGKHESLEKIVLLK